MNLSFTIPYPFIEFMCHAVAAIFYVFAGAEIPNSDRPTLKYWSLWFIAIILTTIGANL